MSQKMSVSLKSPQVLLRCPQTWHHCFSETALGFLYQSCQWTSATLREEELSECQMNYKIKGRFSHFLHNLWKNTLSLFYAFVEKLLLLFRCQKVPFYILRLSSTTRLWKTLATIISIVLSRTRVCLCGGGCCSGRTLGFPRRDGNKIKNKIKNTHSMMTLLIQVDNLTIFWGKPAE